MPSLVDAKLYTAHTSETWHMLDRRKWVRNAVDGMNFAVRFAGIEGAGEAINQRGETVLVCDHLLMVTRRERSEA
jgi:hypothetical protein